MLYSRYIDPYTTVVRKLVRKIDLEKKSKVDELKPEYLEVGKKSREPECVSLAWSADGQTLFAGYTDNKIRCWGVMARG